MSTTGWVVLGVVVVIVLWAISVYNSLVAMRQRVNQSFADIDVQLKQRHDLIPNLVETVKGYAAHERGMRVIVEDYIEKTLSRSALLILNLFVCGLAGALAIFSILKVAFGAGFAGGA